MDPRSGSEASRNLICKGEGYQLLHNTSALDSATRLAMSSAERSKLAGVATGATANDTDANLKARANHTGTQAASTITGLASVATTGSASDLSSGTMPTARLPGLAAQLAQLTTVGNEGKVLKVVGGLLVFADDLTGGGTAPTQLSSTNATRTSANGALPEVDLTMGPDIFDGYILEIGRRTAPGGPTTIICEHYVTPSERAAGKITKAALIEDGYYDPSGYYEQDYRWKREDGLVGPISTISDTVISGGFITAGAPSNVAFSNVNRTATLTAAGAANLRNQTVHRDSSVALYFEVTFHSLGGANVIVGSGGSDGVVTDGYSSAGSRFANGAPEGGSPAFSAGQTIGFVSHPSSQAYGIIDNSGSLTIHGSPSLAGDYPCVNMSGNGASITINTTGPFVRRGSYEWPAWEIAA